jgi:Family of unknown function (DUF6496)
MSKYGQAAQKAVKKEVHRYKRGKAHSGKALKPVKSRAQAIAIALSKARKQGAKVPSKPKLGGTAKTSTAKTRSTTSKTRQKTSTTQKSNRTVKPILRRVK